MDSGRESGDRRVQIAPSPSFSFLWPSITSLKQISFFTQNFAGVKIKDGSNDFHQENIEHSLGKITPALQANTDIVWIWYHSRRNYFECWFILSRLWAEFDPC